jgi:hypothetical protein
MKIAEHKIFANPAVSSPVDCQLALATSWLGGDAAWAANYPSTAVPNARTLRSRLVQVAPSFLAEFIKLRRETSCPPIRSRWILPGRMAAAR